MTFEINHPKQTTYWIFWTDKISNFVYGITEPNQVTQTGQPNWWTTLSEAEWLYKLEHDFNTFPDETN